MLATFVTADSEVTKWWMGEKFDGIRVFWNCNTLLLYQFVLVCWL